MKLSELAELVGWTASINDDQDYEIRIGTWDNDNKEHVNFEDIIGTYVEKGAVTLTIEKIGKGKEDRLISYMLDLVSDLNQLDEPEPQNITLQDIAHRLWELPLNNRKYWLEQLNDEFQEGYIVPLGLKTTDGEEQYLTLNGSYFASRRNRYLQQTFATLEEIPEFYRDLAERVV